MRRTIILLFAVLFSLPGFCQNPKFTWDPPKDKKNDPGIFDIIRQGDADGIFATKGYFRDEITLLHLDNDLNLLKKNENIKIGKSKVNNLSDEYELVSNKSIAIFFTKVKSTGLTNTLYYNIFDNATLEKQGDDVELMSYKLARFKAHDLTRINKYHIVQSADFSQQVIAYNPEAEKDGPAKLRIETLNDDMEMNWSREIELGHDCNKYVFHNVAIGNDGTVYLVGSFQEAEGGDSKIMHSKIELLIVSDGTSQVESEILDFDIPFFRDVNVNIKDQKKVILGGFYSNKDDLFVRGVFSASYDIDTKAIIGSGNYNYTPEFAGHFDVRGTAGTSVKSSKADEGEIHFLELNDVVSTDSGIYVIGEQKYFNNYLSVIVNRFDVNGNFVWSNFFTKNQFAQSSNYLASFKFIENNGSLYFIYNEAKKNIEKNKANTIYVDKDELECVLVTFKPSGEASLEIVPKQDFSPDGYNIGSYYKIQRNKLLTMQYNHGDGTVYGTFSTE